MPIFVDNPTAERSSAVLADAGELAGWSLLSYCLMSNPRTCWCAWAQEGLSVGMHSVTNAARPRFNAVHGTNGHLFERRYHASVIRRDAAPLESVSLHRAQSVARRSHRRPRLWRWSAHSALAGLGPCAAACSIAAAL